MLRKVVVLNVMLCLILKSLSAQVGGIGENMPNTAVVPFLSFGGMLLLQAKVDDQAGYFILDTGAPNLILNKKHFSEAKGVFNDQSSAVGINGQVKGVLAKDASLEIGNQKWKNVYAHLYDLAYLEEAKGIVILGLIGSLLFQNYELTIDFELHELILSRVDKQGEKLEGHYSYRPPDVIVPFKRKAHMPYVEAEVAGNLLNLGIDSGAGIALIVHKKQAELTPFMEIGDSILIRGLAQQTEQAQVFQLYDLRIANLSYASLDVAFANLGYINKHFAGLHLDGILGLDLLSQHRTAINFRKKEIYIWAPKTNSEHLVTLDP